MATSALLSAAEYLATSYRPDCDFVDGEVQERNLGESDHASLQVILSALLFHKRKQWHIRVRTENRVQVSATRFRVPDICVLSADAPHEPIIHHVPLLCIEILSPDDRLSRVKQRIADFLSMGVPQVWLFDTEMRTATVYEGSTAVEHKDGSLHLPGTTIVLELAEIFAALDEN